MRAWVGSIKNMGADGARGTAPIKENRSVAVGRNAEELLCMPHELAATRK